MITLTNHPSYRIVSDHLFAEIRQNESSGQNSLNSLRSFEPGDIISSFHAGEIIDHPTYLTVQVGVGKHITLRPEFLQYINHSCDPNAFFDTTTMQLVCLGPIKTGEEFTFFYPSTEWEMAQPFECYCGSPKCIGVIKGAAYLSADTIGKYRLTDFINKQLKGRLSEVRA